MTFMLNRKVRFCYLHCTALNFTRSFQGHEYALTPDNDWPGSRDDCAAAGGILAVIASPEEDAFLRLQFWDTSGK